MNRRANLLVVCVTSAIFFGACSRPGSSLMEHDDAAEASESRVFDTADTVCSLASRSRRFCQTDFVRLSSNAKKVDGKEIWILGFLAVDGRQLVLYANKDAYELVENGQSILLRSSYSNLVQLLKKYGNQEVRVRGTFRAAKRDSLDSARLGTLHGELYVKHAERRPVTDSTESLAVPIEDLPNERKRGGE